MEKNCFFPITTFTTILVTHIKDRLVYYLIQRPIYYYFGFFLFFALSYFYTTYSVRFVIRLFL